MRVAFYSRGYGNQIDTKLTYNVLIWSQDTLLMSILNAILTTDPANISVSVSKTLRLIMTQDECALSPFYYIAKQIQWVSFNETEI